MVLWVDSSELKLACGRTGTGGNINTASYLIGPISLNKVYTVVYSFDYDLNKFTVRGDFKLDQTYPLNDSKFGKGLPVPSNLGLSIGHLRPGRKAKFNGIVYDCIYFNYLMDEAQLINLYNKYK